jgi:hypothetical protein
MYILDTNVVSELRKPEQRIDPHVAAWGRTVDPHLLHLSVITVLELEIGVRRLERRDREQGAALRKWMDEAVLVAFAGRILPFGTTSALRCAILHVPDPQPDRDSIIAATALVEKMTVVTRNVSDFAPMGVKVLNPWELGPRPARQPPAPRCAGGGRIRRSRNPRRHIGRSLRGGA